MISILILTKNEEQDLPGCLASVAWSDDVHVFDSFSEDSTLEIAKKSGANITQRVFDNWSAHQNWGLENIKFKYPWVLYIDADERVSESLVNAINTLQLDNKSSMVAYELQRRDFAWNGKWLKYSQMSPFYLRLFRPDKMHYERLVNPVSIPDGPTGKIEGFLDHYPFSKGFKFWIQRHLSYADMEALTRVKDLDSGVSFSLKKALFSSNFAEKRYHQKGIFYKLPGRPLIKWFYMVIIRRAFLDGSAGFTYATLQSIYEYFIVLKSEELLKQKKNN
ncbi:glycosyltransferase involved in cell wall biosynthesis [Flavobacterium chryseum]|uniref:glycosyltransferase family 2 protein n=1 Tax=Flavobacterium sp. P3160 TaxID=2512113 RepID=UPI00105DBAE6|nr:glycosyltransferase family 2 protein [Flavobacterium sp. P3160]TDO71514.1 glycosyltransferase involved in cell wall biosynthesis [Flavobacterium sp. P3160]